MFKYRILSAILVVFSLLTLAGCKDKTEDAYIYFELPETPVTLDPQTASSDAELLIVRNIYEGLMRIDETGKVSNGACTEYSKNGLTYTFTLREDMFWNNGDELTAKDFVFGLRRALDPKTMAPFASRLFCIKNAKEINSGALSPENLGVSAPNDSTVKITLEYEDSDFLYNLTTSVAQPCNENFFKESAGKYGLFKDYIISCGSYRLTKWNKESFGIRLYKNEEYNGTHVAKNAAVFITCNNDKPVTEKLKENNIDIAFIDSAQSSEMETAGLKTADIQNICWVMTMSSEFTLEMRTALFSLVGSNVFSENLKDGYVSATSIYPKICNAVIDDVVVNSYDLEQGKALYSQEVKKLEGSKFPSDIKLTYYDNGYVKPIVTDIVGHWQSNLSAFVNIEAVNDAQILLPQLKSQTLWVAVFPVKAPSQNNTEYLSNYGTLETNLSLAQENITKSKNIIPLFFQDTTLCYSQNILELPLTEDNGFIDFAFVVKTED
ncbi:MAG: hypothetical protein J6B22_00205 [Clostridia bacterium]|nr:hypothetical protein [Clostridia bacterium]